MTRTCQQCGAVLPGRAAEWLCPKCLLRQAATPVNFLAEAPPDRNAAVLPRAIHYFGDYELVHEIARGGMGVVYKARQVSLNRTVAVKMLLYGKLAGGDFIKRFRAEAEAAANLQHPNIVAIHEVGEHEGQQYFSMDYVEGSDLAALVREKPLPARRAATFLKAIAEAIHYAHQRGILHRDLKPSNILIDQQDQPRITDFGLAKRLTSDSQLSTASDQLTVTGQVLGTPHYMPPEQAGGKRGEMTPASDVYSLGAILYHLLTGRPPFLADTLEAALTQLLHNEPAPPRLLNASVPRDLETICLKCLNKEPQRRYGSANALAEDLGRWLGGEPVQARPASRGERLWSWCRRKPALAVAIAVINLTVAVGLAGIIWQWRRAETNATVATANLRDSYLAQAKALRASSQAGHRTEALEVIAKAAAIQPSPELRNEAIANFAQTDIRVINLHPVSEFGDNEAYDPSFTLAAVQHAKDRIQLEKAFARERIAEIRPPRGIPAAWRRFSPDQRYLAFDTSTDGICIEDIMHGTLVVSGLEGDLLGDFSPDSRVYARAVRDGSISFIELPSGQESRRIGDGVPVQGVCFDPSGARLACWDSRRIEIVDAASGAHLLYLGSPIETANPSEGLHRRVVWSGNGSLLAASGPDRQLHVWVAESGRLIQTLLGPSDVVISVAMNPSGELLAASSFDDTTQLWEVATGRRLATVPKAVRNLAFSRDGRFLGPGRVGRATNCVFEIVRPVGFRRLSPPVLETSVKKVHAMDFSPDGGLIAVAGADGVLLWDCLMSRFLAMLPAPEACSAVFDPDGSGLLISASGQLSRWPLRFEEEPGRRTLAIGPPQEIGLGENTWGFATVDPQRGRLAVASGARPAMIMNLREPRGFVQLEQVHTNGNNIALSPDGRYVATGTWRGSNVWISDARTGKLLHEHPTSTHATVAFSPDGRWLMTAGEEYHALPVGTWTNWQIAQQFKGEHEFGGMAFSPDGRLWVRIKTSTSYELIEPGTWQVVAVLQSPYPFALGWPRFSRDGTMFAAADSAHGVQIWDLRELRGALRLMGLDWDHPVYPLAAPDPVTNLISVQVLAR